MVSVCTTDHLIKWANYLAKAKKTPTEICKCEDFKFLCKLVMCACGDITCSTLTGKTGHSVDTFDCIDTGRWSTGTFIHISLTEHTSQSEITVKNMLALQDV